MSEIGCWLGRGIILSVVGFLNEYNWGTKIKCRLCLWNFFLFAQVYTSYGSSSLKRVRWLRYLFKPGVPPTKAHLRQLPHPGPGTDSLQHQIPSHSPVVRSLGRHPLSTGITPPGSSGSGKQPKDSHGPKQIKLFCSIFLSYLDNYRGLKTNLSCFHLFCSPGLLYKNTE